MRSLGRQAGKIHAEGRKLRRNSSTIGALAVALVSALAVFACDEDVRPGSGQGSGGGEGPSACTRQALSSALDAYFTALAAHDPSKLSLASGVKYTEKGAQVPVGQGLWQTAGAVKFTRRAIDAKTCNVVAQAVLPKSGRDIVYGVRLKLAGGQISEIETIPVEPGDYFGGTSPSGLLSTRGDDWETPIPAADRMSRDEMTLVLDRYFKLFPGGACNFADTCERRENGASFGNCSFLLSCSNRDPAAVSSAMAPRLHVLDEEAGIAVGFVMWTGQYADFHMFKLRGRKVAAVHAVLAQAAQSGWD